MIWGFAVCSWHHCTASAEQVDNSTMMMLVYLKNNNLVWQRLNLKREIKHIFKELT
jgi:hypothetical protein